MTHPVPVRSTCFRASRRALLASGLLALLASSTPALTGLAAVNTYGGGWYDTNVDLVIIECSNMTQHKIVTGGAYGACISPDGRQVAYIKNRNSIRICNIDGTGDHEVTTNTGFSGEAGSALSWLPNDFIMWGAGNDVNRVKSDGTGRAKVCTMSDHLITATFSDDGTKGAGFTYAWSALAFDVCGSVKWKLGGCQGSISPSGAYSTHNTDHHSLHVREFSNGNLVKTIGLSGNVNNHKFSRHSNDWVMYTTCTNGQNGCGGGSSEAWLVEWRSGAKHKLGNLIKAWDYHPTAVYGPAEPPRATKLTIAPTEATVEFTKTVKLTGSVVDQFGTPMATQPAISWTITGAGNSINATGLVTAGSTAGTFTATATSGTFSATASVRVVSYAPVDLKIDCGATASGALWTSDQTHASGGAAYDFGITADISGVLNPAPVSVYSTVRHQDHSYSFTVPNGTYKVRLHFVDAMAADGRAMNYTIEGRQVITGMSVVREAGGVNKALVKEFTTTVADGSLQIVASQGSGNDVFEAAIEVLRTDESSTRVAPASAQTAPSRMASRECFTIDGRRVGPRDAARPVGVYITPASGRSAAVRQ